MWPFSSPYPIQSLQSVSRNEYDFIVVGGGTAGCVLAARLTENLTTRVLVLERGKVLDTWASRNPLMSSNSISPSAPAHKWQSVPHESLGGKVCTMVTGKALGGGSAMNGQLYTRSVPGEYDAWAEAGRKGWGWTDVEPYFIKSETSLTEKESPHRGHDGPWKNQPTVIQFNSVKESIEAAALLGCPLVTANEPSSPVCFCTRVDATIDEDNHRCSTFGAFIPLKVATDRKDRLHICPSALVRAIDVQDTSDGPKAIGVTVENETGGTDHYHISASREVIVCAGAIGTPHLLLLSGIGPAKDLGPLGIRVITDLPGVGAHLQDHTSVPIIYKVPLSDSMEVLMAKPLVAIRRLLEYVFAGTGVFGCQVQQSTIFFHSNLLDEDGRVMNSNDAEVQIPDVEVMILPISASRNPAPGLAKSFGGLSYLCTILRPKSFGSVRLTSIDPRVRPACDFGLLSESQDYQVMCKAIRFAIALGQQMQQRGYPLEPLRVPSDKELDEFIKQEADTTYHYSSTCRMAPESEMGVVDDELRVYGVKNLSIADASIFPQIPACHLQAPVVMVAERCADFLIRRHFGAP